MNRLLFILTMLLPAFSGFSQTFKAYVKAADNAFFQKDFYSAMQYYAIGLEIEEDRTDLLYKYAESARLFNAYAQADSAYTEVLSRDTAGTAFPEALFWSASMKKNLGLYDDASIAFAEFAATPHPVDSMLVVKATQEIDICQWAKTKKANPDPDIELDSISLVINTPYSEFAAYEVDDSLFYTSYNELIKRDEYEPDRFLMKTYFLDDSTQNYTKEMQIDKGNEKKHVAFLTFNTDRSRVYYSKCGYVSESSVELTCELYYREVLPGNYFGKEEKLPSYINVPKTSNLMPNLGVDETTGYEYLFYVSDRPDGKGGRDVWCSVINQNDSISMPVNIDSVNTAQDELTPFFHAGTQVLYFSTDGRQGMGGYDIYQVAKNNQQWGSALHLSAPLNSSMNDISYTINDLENKGYLASNREGSVSFNDDIEYCCYDIFAFNRNVFYLDVATFDAFCDKPLPGVEIELFRVVGKERYSMDVFMNPKTNKVEFPPLSKGIYYLIANKDGYEGMAVEIDLTNPGKGPTISQELRLEPLDMDMTVVVTDKESGDALEGCTLQLLEDEEQIDIRAGEEEETTFEYELERAKEYTLIVAKPGWHPDTIKLDRMVMQSDCKYLLPVPLLKKDIIDFPPLYLYFDNNKPTPVQGRASRTEIAYRDTYNDYYARKPVFIEEYSKALDGRDRFLAEQQVKAFFEREVREEYESLLVFCEQTLKYLEKEVDIVITITGYTSPRGSAIYNQQLSERRISSLLNEFEVYNNGVLKPYLNTGRLKIVEVSVGESRSNPKVVDKLEDLRNSVYSPLASIERRVEIIGVTLNENQ